MDSAEKKMWVSVIAQAIKDAHGPFSVERDFDKQYENFEKFILNFKNSSKFKEKNPSILRILYPETGGGVEAFQTREARAWFCNNDYNAKSLKEVCGYADVCPQRLSKQMREIISKLRTLEQKLLQKYKEINNGTIC